MRHLSDSTFRDMLANPHISETIFGPRWGKIIPKIVPKVEYFLGRSPVGLGNDRYVRGDQYHGPDRFSAAGRARNGLRGHRAHREIPKNCPKTPKIVPRSKNCPKIISWPKNFLKKCQQYPDGFTRPPMAPTKGIWAIETRSGGVASFPVAPKIWDNFLWDNFWDNFWDNLSPEVAGGFGQAGFPFSNHFESARNRSSSSEIYFPTPKIIRIRAVAMKLQLFSRARF